MLWIHDIELAWSPPSGFHISYIEDAAFVISLLIILTTVTCVVVCVYERKRCGERS